jgi:hypothetical protein
MAGQPAKTAPTPLQLLCGGVSCAGRLKAGDRPGAGFGRFHFAIAGRGVRHQTVEQLPRGLRHLVHRPIERKFVCFRRPGETAQLADELQGRRPDFVIRGRWLEVVQSLNISTHKRSSVRLSYLKTQTSDIKNSGAKIYFFYFLL